MKKCSKILLALFVMVLLPLGVRAEVKTVNTEAELKEAINDSSVTEITLGADIETQGKINITRDLTIDGAGYSITYGGLFYNSSNPDGVLDNTVWSSKSTDGTSGAVYVIQVYMANVTLKDVVLAGGNRGLGVNGGKVTLESSIGFVNNGYQDIELSHGSAVPTSNVSTLIVEDGAVVVTDGEVDSDVTTWLVYVDDQDGMIGTKTITKGTSLKSTEFGADLIVLYPVGEEGEEISADVFANSKTNGNSLGFGFVDENGDNLYTWAFVSSDITDPTIAVNTGITFTDDAPSAIKSDVSKLVTTFNNVTYLNFAHDGALPGKASVTYYVGDKYDAGTKLYIAHYNESTKKLEDIGEAIVDEDGNVTFDITECSSYVLYTGTEVDNSNANTVVENANTGDINLIIMISVIAMAAVGLVITCKKLVTR